MRTRDPARRRHGPALMCLLSALVMALAGCSMSNGGGSRPVGPGDPPRKATSLTYVALGDSYSAAPLVPVTDVANGCFRSSHNYPSIVARKLRAHLDDRSCGGARTVDFRRSEFPDVPPQRNALRPGVDLVTIGIGGNDERVFSRLVHQCTAVRSRDPEGSPCRDVMRSNGPDALLSALHRTTAKVTGLVRAVRKRVPQAQVLVVGYPQIVSAQHACSALPLARGDYAYAERVNLALTDMLQTGARAAGAAYVDVWSASRGHDICSDDPWVNGSLDDEKRAARYHPFAEEQRAVADLVLRKVRALH